MAAIRWFERATARSLPTMAVGGVPLDWKPSPPTCHDCDFTNPDAEVVYAHLMSVHSNRRKNPARASRRPGERRAAWE